MRTVTLAIAALAAAGCQNPTTGVVGAEAGALPDLRAQTDQPAPTREAGPAVRLDGSPVAPGQAVARSVESLDRSGWQPQDVVRPCCRESLRTTRTAPQ